MSPEDKKNLANLIDQAVQILRRVADTLEESSDTSDRVMGRTLASTTTTITPHAALLLVAATGPRGGR